MAVRDLGIVTAYGYAKAGGYTGTEQEFTALLGDLALTVEDLENMTVSVTTLEPNQQATASYADGVLSLGIPKGVAGEVQFSDLENYATNEDLYGAYIVKSASGDIASFSDGADNLPMKSLNVTITPKQSGSGDPSPSNVRPISGWTDADVTVMGKNMFPLAININDSTYVHTYYKANYPALADFFKVLKMSIGKTVIFSAKTTGTPAAGGADVGCMRILSGGSLVAIFNPNQPYQIAEKDYESADAIFIYGSANGATVKDYQVELGSTATDFEPYTGHTTPVPLGQTVYGGTVDVTTGVLTITESEIVHLKNLNWASNSQGPQKIEIYTTSTNSIKANGVSNVISNMFKNRTALVEEAEYSIRGYAGTGSIAVGMPTSVVGDYDGAIAWLNEHDPIMVYELKTPTTVQLTPVQVATLLGTNNVWSDAGSVEVEYRADPTLAYNGISPSLASVIAPVERTNIATRNYTTGSLLIMNNTLYKVTANIANGGAITPNTNVTATTLSEVISALQ